MPNLTQEQASKLLAALGYKDAQIVADDAADADFSQDDAVRAVDESRVAFHRPAIEKEIGETAASAAAGKFGGVMRHQLAKATGIPSSELSKIGKDDEAIAYAIGKLKEGLSGNEKTMQDAIEKERAEWAEKEKALQEEWNGKLQQQVDRYNDRAIDDWISEGLKDAPILNGADRSAVAKLVKADLRSNFDLQYDEESKATKVINRADKLPAKNKAGTDNFNLKEYSEGVLKPYNLWQTDMRNNNPLDALNKSGSNGGERRNSADTSSDAVVAAGQRALGAPALQG